jgi:hypothetical protein
MTEDREAGAAEDFEVENSFPEGLLERDRGGVELPPRFNDISSIRGRNMALGDSEIGVIPPDLKN